MPISPLVCCKQWRTCFEAADLSCADIHQGNESPGQSYINDYSSAKANPRSMDGFRHYCPSSPYNTDPGVDRIPYSDFMSLVGVELIGEGVYAILFGFSFSTSLLCLYYLFKNWKPTRSHRLTTAFTLILTIYNIFVVVARIMTLLWNICKGPTLSVPLQVGPSISTAEDIVGVFYLPVFFWISDAFLLYRAWDVWVHRRSVIILPGLVYLLSIGLVFSVLVIKVPFRSPLSGYTPAIESSLGLDVIVTGMIAGRLIYHHRRISASTHGSFSVLPIAVIFIESAALSVLSKGFQMVLESPNVSWINPWAVPFIIPLCTLSSNFIILRKALGADVTRIVDQHRDRISTIRFQGSSHQPSTESIGRIPGGFEFHLRTMLGEPADGSNDDLEHGREPSRAVLRLEPKSPTLERASL